MDMWTSGNGPERNISNVQHEFFVENKIFRQMFGYFETR